MEVGILRLFVFLAVIQSVLSGYQNVLPIAMQTTVCELFLQYFFIGLRSIKLICYVF